VGIAAAAGGVGAYNLGIFENLTSKKSYFLKDVTVIFFLARLSIVLLDSYPLSLSLISPNTFRGIGRQPIKLIMIRAENDVQKQTADWQMNVCQLI
jgi:hypothetical protein